MSVTIDDIKAAAEVIDGDVVKTPCTRSQTLSALTGAELVIKFENLQFTGSFKDRGSLVKLNSLTPDESAAGVIAMSAGNHAQAVAHHATRLGIASTIVMPEGTPQVKAQNTQRLGARRYASRDGRLARPSLDAAERGRVARPCNRARRTIKMSPDNGSTTTGGVMDERHN